MGVSEWYWEVLDLDKEELVEITIENHYNFRDFPVPSMNQQIGNGIDKKIRDYMDDQKKVECPTCRERHPIFDTAKLDGDLGLYRVLLCKKQGKKPFVELRGNKKYGTIVIGEG